MVLIVNRSKRLAASISEIFHYMGILSRTATPSEALSELSCLYRAVLVIEPSTLPDPEDYVNRLRAYSSSTPIFSVSNNGAKDSYATLFDASFKLAISSAILASKMADYSKAHGLSYIGDYRLAGINACCDRPFVDYFGRDIGLTKTEAMIVRYFIRSYPNFQSAEDVLKYAFKPSRHPEVSSIKTHISLINKKFRALEGRNLIFMSAGEGYQILTPEYIEIQREQEKVHASVTYND